MIKNIYMFLGLARRANALVLGEEVVTKEIKRGRVDLVVVASDVSMNTREGVVKACYDRGIDIRFFGMKEELGGCVGKGIVAVIGVKDKGFSKRLVEMMDDIKN